MTYLNEKYSSKAILKIKGPDRYHLIRIIEFLETRYQIDPNWVFKLNRGEPGVHCFIHITGEKEEKF